MQCQARAQWIQVIQLSCIIVSIARQSIIWRGLTHTLLPRSFCSLEHFTSKWFGTLCFPTHFAPQQTLFPDTLYSSAHFAHRNTFLLSTLCFMEHFASQNTLLFVFQRAKYVAENILQRSKMLQGAEYSRKQNVLGSKVFQEAMCFRDLNVLRSKLF